ncbi:MAG TPA: RNA-binding protein [Acidobacteriaceae bacterium]|jgi:cold-inducible RNA-binding protein|nr:RNA-binding protein [Acidobacteriaceae bacterium]
MKKLYVGNLSFDATDDELRQMFETHGTVESAKIATDRDTGRSRGFGFIEMSGNQEADAAIAALNGREVGGRALIVNEARPKTSGFGGGRSGGREGNRGRSGGGRGGYRY